MLKPVLISSIIFISGLLFSCSTETVVMKADYNNDLYLSNQVNSENAQKSKRTKFLGCSEKPQKTNSQTNI